MKRNWITVGVALGVVPGALATSPMPPENQRYTATIATSEDTCGARDFLDNLIKNPHYLSEAEAASADNPSLRIVSPMTPVTMDYRADRLTVVVDRDAQTITLKCG